MYDLYEKIAPSLCEITYNFINRKVSVALSMHFHFLTVVDNSKRFKISIPFTLTDPIQKKERDEADNSEKYTCK